MSRFGNFILERKLKKAFTFIIKTAIVLITSLKIWSVYQLGNILNFLEKSTRNWLRSIWKELGRWLRFGTSLKLGVNGILKILVNNGSIPVSSSANVLNAGDHLNHSILMRSFAQDDVQWQTQETKGDIQSQEYVPCARENLSVNISTLGRTHVPRNVEVPSSAKNSLPVYNISVSGDHCYFANGILVSNCDALAYQAPYWKTPGTKAPKRTDPYMSLNWWKKQKPPSSDVLSKIFDDFRS
jgi:hypothetical protein